MSYDSIFVPHHLQNLSSTTSLLPQKEHDFALAGVTFVGIRVILPSTLPPQFGQKLASDRIEDLHRIQVEVDFLVFFLVALAGAALAGATLDEVFDFNFFCPLRAKSAATIITPTTTIIIIRIG